MLLFHIRTKIVMFCLTTANVEVHIINATPSLFIVFCYDHSCIEAFIKILLNEFKKYGLSSLQCIKTGSDALIHGMVALIPLCFKSYALKQC